MENSSLCDGKLPVCIYKQLVFNTWALPKPGKEGAKRMENQVQLCPNCQTGLDSLELDKHSPMCPYLCYHNGTACTKYKAMQKNAIGGKDQIHHTGA